MIGKVLANRYEIIAWVGEGGMAVVYRAKDTLLGRMVAVKVLRPQYANDVEFVERFRREAQTAASLSHPNVVNIYDVGREDNTHYIVMEYVEGRNLKDIIRQEGPLPWRTAVFIAIEICRALQAAHRLNLTHRDIKPHNILITKQDGSVKVTDFGIARANATASLTQTGTVVGSVHYFSPEQARGDIVGSAADIYSLGVVLFEMVTGRVPFTGESPVAIALKHLQEQPPPLHTINPAIPMEVERIITKAMGKTVAERYATVGGMLRDLRAIVNEPTGTDEDTDNDITQPIAPVKLDATTVQPAVSRQTGQPQASQRKKPIRWPAIVIILAFMAGLFLASTRFPQFFYGEEVSVPSVIGREYSEAEQIIKQAGLNVERRDIYHSTVEVNYVIDQHPAAHERIRKNRPVVLSVSRGAELVTVPDVIGLPLQQAQISIETSGLKVGLLKEEVSPGDAGLILRQTPSGGDRLARDGQVDLVISIKSGTALLVTVPDLIGYQLDEARTRLAEHGLKIGRTIEEINDTVQPNTIIDHNPTAGADVPAGTSVDVAYAIQPNVRTVQVVVRVPNDDSHIVKVTVVDELGERRVYGPEKRSAGTVFTVPVSVRPIEIPGIQRKYRIYIDDQLVEEDKL